MNGLEVTVPSSTSSASIEVEKEYCPQLCASVNHFRKNGEFCDIVLKAGSNKYSVHKMMIAAFSPVLKAILSSDSSAISFEGGQPVLSLSDIDGVIMEAILDYGYQGKINITKDNVHSILQAANFLQVNSLFQASYRFLLDDINVENCLGLWSLAEVYSCDALREKARKFSLENFEGVSGECEFLELESEKLIEILKEDTLKVEEEYIVFYAVLQWMHFKEERIKCFDQVLRQVRLAHVDNLALNDRFLQDEMLRKSETCRRILEEANKYNLLTNRRLERQSSITRRRTNSPQIEALEVCYHVQNGEHLVNRSLLVTEDGRVLQSLTPPDWASDSLSNCVKCCNYKVFSHSDDFSIYGQRMLDYFEEIDPPSKIRSDCAFGELDGLWYSFGGSCEGQAYSDIVERYDASKKMWTYCAPLLKAVHHPAVVTLEGMIYVLGGINGTEWSKNVQRFNPRSIEWTLRTSFPENLQRPQACGLNRRIYVCSETASNKMYVYDVTTDEWSPFADLRHNYVAGPILLNGRIFVLLKKDCGQLQLEVYSPETSTWQEFATFSGISPHMIAGPYLFNRKREEDTSNADKVNFLRTNN